MAKQKQPDTLIINEINIQKIDRSKKDISNWISAIQSAENPTNPNRKPLYDIFRRVLLDLTVYSAYKKRIRKVKNKRIKYVEEGKDTSQINKDFFEAPWFSKMTQGILETVFWGHTLLEFELKEGYINDVYTIPRHHVRPKFEIITINSSTETNGIHYKEPPYTNYILEVGDNYDLGLLHVASSNALQKISGTSDFSTFVEQYGYPLTVYEYDPMIPESKALTEQAAREQGFSNKIIKPRGMADVSVITQASVGVQQIHKTFLDTLKEELLILILGQTMTTSNGSSRSQAEVHEREQDEITREDMLFVEYVLNWEAKEKFIALGLPISLNGSFKFEETDNRPIDQQLEMDLKLAEIVDIPADYFYEKYGIPRPAPNDEVAKKKALSRIKTRSQNWFSVVERVFLEVWQGALKRGDIDEELYERYRDELTEAIRTGFGASLQELDFESADYEMLFALEKNAKVFSAHKTWGFVGELSDLAKALKNEAGGLATYTQFRTQALAIHQEYNITWLRTEYNTAINQAQSARKWIQIEAQKEVFPNLKFKAILDPNTRDDHRSMNNIVRPVDDPLWKTHLPPLGWNCRCTVQQTDEEATELPDELATVAKGFQNNVGLTKEIFDKTHSYYENGDSTMINAMLNDIDPD